MYEKVAPSSDVTNQEDTKPAKKDDCCHDPKCPSQLSELDTLIKTVFSEVDMSNPGAVQEAQARLRAELIERGVRPCLICALQTLP